MPLYHGRWSQIDQASRIGGFVRSRPALQGAVALHHGNLLGGLHYDWCISERERLRHMYLAMLDKLMDYCEAHHDYEAGIVYGDRILCHDRARERTHRRLMRLHYLNRDRTAALRQYTQCTAALHEEMGVRPSRQTVALCERIKADRLSPALPPETGTRLACEASSAALVEMLDRLAQLSTELSDMQRRVQHEIESIEVTLRRSR